MFSQNGYAGTNIRELSESLGLVKSAMYRHFESKDAIWNTLLDELIAYYEAWFGSVEHLPPVPDYLEELVTTTMRMPSGERVKLLNDKNIYLGAQIGFADLGICYGVVADTGFILICSYSVNGSEPELTVYQKR